MKSRQPAATLNKNNVTIMSFPQYFGVTSIQSEQDLLAVHEKLDHKTLSKLGNCKFMTGVLYASPFLDLNAVKSCRHVAEVETQARLTIRAAELGFLPMHHIEMDKSWPIKPNDSREQQWLVEHIKGLSSYKQGSTSLSALIIQINGFKEAAFYRDVASSCKKFGIEIKFVYQLRNKELALLDSSEKCSEILTKLQEIQDLLVAIICDGSAGTGTPFDLQDTLESARILGLNFPALGLCLAGGLSTQTSKLKDYTKTTVIKALQSNPKFSFDHESGARVLTSDGEKDTFCPHAAADCLNLITQAAVETVLVAE